jgi:glucose-1-phosphate cytidylyltransferase
MKVVILAGGFGTRLSELTDIRPKPMVEIDGKPILWHIMKIYSSYGFNDFVICLGYKSYFIKEYFANYFLHQSDVTFDLLKNEIDVHNTKCDPWKVTLVDTGLQTLTGGRLKRIKKYVQDGPFHMTYGDGVSNVNLLKLLEFHNSQGKLATVTAVQPAGRFGSLEVAEDCSVNSFMEKPKGDGAWINGGFFILEPEALDYIADDSTSWELDPLEALAKDNQLAAFKHTGFWKAMDTLRDKHELEKLLQTNKAEWKQWDE